MPVAAIVSDIPPHLDPQIVSTAINRAVEAVCSTMLGVKVTPRGASNGELSSAKGDGNFVIGSVGFVGDINGIVYLCLSEDFANFATQRTLGMTAAEIAEEGFELIKDTIGELTNMTVGSFKNVLCDAGHPCMLTLPTIIRASQLSTGTSKSAHRTVYKFDCAGHGLSADIQVRME